MIHQLEKIYKRRFSIEMRNSLVAINREKAWDLLVSSVFQKLINKNSAILDLGCGPGYFINRIDASKKFAVDLDKSNARSLKFDVDFHKNSSENLVGIANNSIDYVFSSNLFEHLESIELLLKTLEELKRIMFSGSDSRLIIMMPNIKKTGMKFYDFIDHRLPLTDSSLVEALEISGFQVKKIIPGFFPYSSAKIHFKIPGFFCYCI